MTIQSTEADGALIVADTADPTETDATSFELWVLCRSNPRYHHRKSRALKKHGENSRGSHPRGRGSAAVEL